TSCASRGHHRKGPRGQRCSRFGPFRVRSVRVGRLDGRTDGRARKACPVRHPGVARGPPRASMTRRGKTSVAVARALATREHPPPRVTGARRAHPATCSFPAIPFVVLVNAHATMIRANRRRAVLWADESRLERTNVRTGTSFALPRDPNPAFNL